MRTRYKLLCWPLSLLLLLSCCARKEDPGKTLVYITPAGTHYHHQGCAYLGQDVLVLALTDAIQKGYTPCSECYTPPAAPAPAPAPADTPAVERSSPVHTGTARQQCTATTHKGTRCKRTTTHPSGRCWQHQDSHP